MAIEKAAVEHVAKAKAQVVEGALTIWNARLEAMVAAGDLKGAISHMGSAVEGGNNCDCGCGGYELRQALTQPA